MFRNALGWVDFVWGDEDVTKASGKTKHAMGLSHILEARQRKDGMTQKEVISLLSGMVEVIASGQEIRRNTVENSTTVALKKGKVEVLLTKHKASNAWVVSGWNEKNPVANAAGSVAGIATVITPTTAQRDKGAGFGEIVAQNHPDGNLDIRYNHTGKDNGLTRQVPQWAGWILGKAMRKKDFCTSSSTSKRPRQRKPSW